eukprot:TRINITY_DN30856_c0_g1_i1.p1 TRINITY_DN30856_c0_g1~~TRINITY_DN30856_c0_g1_i1.p1  ORF type:complete len:757 (-),score=186.86 TRINITY_DN30856_c0_g1_i1:140-2410(-)
MKFGKQIKRLVDPEHLNHCISYDILKKAIDVVVASEQRISEHAEPELKAEVQEVSEAFGQDTPKDFSLRSVRPLDSRFHELLQHELAKVNRFAALLVRTILDCLREAHRDLSQRRHDEKALEDIERRLESAAEDLVKLENFRRLNFTGFRKISKKFDKSSSGATKTLGALSSWFVPQLLREFFVAAPINPLILCLSWGYAGLRRARRESAGLPDLAPLTPEVKPSRVATKSDLEASGDSAQTFWLMPSSRVRAMCALLRRFEVDLNPSEGAVSSPVAGEASIPLERRHKLVMEMTPERLELLPHISNQASLEYYDTPAFPAYERRLKEERAVGFRCRWTDRSAGAGGAQLFVERDGTGAVAGEEAFPLASAPGAAAEEGGAIAAIRDSASSALARAKAQDQPTLAAFAAEVLDAAETPQLRPMAAVGSVRVRLRGDTHATQGVNIAFDEDVQFSHGRSGPALTAKGSTVDFPYCLLAVDSPDALGRRDWLDEVRSFAALRSIGGFSVGVQAVATLHRDSVPRLPHWFEHLAVVEASAPPEAWGLTLEWRAAIGENIEFVRKCSQTPNLSRAASPAYGMLPSPMIPSELESIGEAVSAKLVTAAKDAAASSGAGAASAQAQQQVKRLEPKNHLATERTMLEWMHTVLALSFIGIGLWRSSIGNEPKGDLHGLLPSSRGPNFLLACYGLVLAALGVIFAWCAAIRHANRNSALLEDKLTEKAFNDRRMPALFALCVAGALFVHLVLQIKPLVVGGATS